MASPAYRPLHAPKSTTAWKMVMHQGRSIESVADELKTTPQRVEHMLFALARRRAERLMA